MNNYNIISSKNYKKECLDFISLVFNKVNGLDLHVELRDVNYDISRVIVHNNKIVGLYLLAKKNEPFNNTPGKGLQGVALAILPEHRGIGLSKLLIDYSYNLGFNYVWGEHDKQLQNLDHWLKIRQLLMENEDSYFTIKYLQ